MGNILCFLLMIYFTLRVAISEQSNYDDPNKEGPFNNIWDIQKKEDPLEKTFESFADGPPPQFPESDSKCHIDNMQCLARVEHQAPMPVCAHQPKYGLVSFPTHCNIYLENCLIQSYETRTGKKSIKEPYYYNRKGKDCQYYTQQTYTIENAIQLYYLLGKVRPLRRNGDDTQNEQQSEQKLP